ncbi:MAG: hypothetical protein AABW75_03035 [Nanoarchaeota archaeon]
MKIIITKTIFIFTIIMVLAGLAFAQLTHDEEISQLEQELSNTDIYSSSLKTASMIFGDLDGPNVCLQKAFKLRSSINNIQVPGMALRSNAGLPVHYFWRDL